MGHNPELANAPLIVVMSYQSRHSHEATSFFVKRVVARAATVLTDHDGDCYHCYHFHCYFSYLLYFLVIDEEMMTVVMMMLLLTMATTVIIV